jgi:hypothetical protein
MGATAAAIANAFFDANAHNAFAAESFLDEIAKDRGLDLIAFRLTLSEGQSRMQTSRGRRNVRLEAAARWPPARGRHHGQGRHPGGRDRRGVGRPRHRADRAVLPAVVLVGRNLAVVVDRGAHVGEMGRAVIVPAVLCPTCCDMIAAAWAACS